MGRDKDIVFMVAASTLLYYLSTCLCVIHLITN